LDHLLAADYVGGGEGRFQGLGLLAVILHSAPTEITGWLRLGKAKKLLTAKIAKKIKYGSSCREVQFDDRE
jgi:hypothetical protein